MQQSISYFGWWNKYDFHFLIIFHVLKVSTINILLYFYFLLLLFYSPPLCAVPLVDARMNLTLSLLRLDTIISSIFLLFLLSSSFYPCEMTIHFKMYPGQRAHALTNLSEGSQFTLSPAQIIFGAS